MAGEINLNFKSLIRSPKTPVMRLAIGICMLLPKAKAKAKPSQAEPSQAASSNKTASNKRENKEPEYKNNGWAPFLLKQQKKNK